MLLMDSQNLILFTTGFVNLAMSIFIFFRGQKNKINLYFSFMTLCVFLWAASLILYNLSTTEESLRFFSSLPYAMAWLVIIFLLYFSIYFPYKKVKVNKLFQWLINTISILIIMYTVFGYNYFVDSVRLGSINFTIYNDLGYAMYTTLMVVIIFLAIYFLVDKYLKSEGIFRTQIGLVLFGVITGTVFGTYFNLFSMYQDNFTAIHIGPLFTLFINLVVFGFIVSSKEKISN